jgi:hypothetical protein
VRLVALAMQLEHASADGTWKIVGPLNVTLPNVDQVDDVSVHQDLMSVDVNRKGTAAHVSAGSAFRLLELGDLRACCIDQLRIGVGPPGKPPPAFDRLSKEDPGPRRK